MTPDEILGLADDFISLSQQGKGREAWSKRLTMPPEDMDADQLAAALVYVAKTTLFPGGHSAIEPPHLRVVAWAGQLAVLGPPSLTRQGDLANRLCELAVRCALVEPSSTGNDRHSQHLVRESNLVLSMVAFPLVETLCREGAAGAVAPDGIVLRAFQVPSHDPHGAPRHYRPGARCSNFSDIARVCRDDLAGGAQRSFDAVVDHYGHVGSRNGYAVIGDWRNEAMHGADHHSTIGFSLLAFALLLVLTLGRTKFVASRASSLGLLQAVERGQLPYDTGLYPIEGYADPPPEERGFYGLVRPG